MRSPVNMKGIILAGGSGSRLYPLTEISSKQLQAVYDKPMIYYPLTTLIAAGIRDICIVTTPADMPRFKNLLSNGEQWGVSLSYITQPKPKGIADALILTEKFIGESNCTLILGDNIFSGGSDIPDAIRTFSSGATIFAYQVPDPSNYGVVEFSRNLVAVSLEEKPTEPKSNYAIPGIYIYDADAINLAKMLSPSKRGELEITDLNKKYLEQNKLTVCRLSRGFAWLDSGNSESLHEASTYIAAIEKRQGVKIGCPEEASLVRGFISVEGIRPSIDRMPACTYKNYMVRILHEFSQSSI